MAQNYDDYKAPVGTFIEEVDIETETMEKDKKKKDESGDSIKAYAQMLQDMGGEDSILAHITPDEADLLKMLGGSGDVSALTSLMMFNPNGTQVDEEEYRTNIAQQLDAELSPVTPEQSPQVKLIPIEGYGSLEIGQEGAYPVSTGPDYETDNDVQSKYYWGVNKADAPETPFGRQSPMPLLTAEAYAPPGAAPTGLPSAGTAGGKSMQGMFDEDERKRLFG